MTRPTARVAPAASGGGEAARGGFPPQDKLFYVRRLLRAPAPPTLVGPRAAAMGLTLAELQDIQARAPGTAVALALALTRVRALRRRPI